jgi:hypothetical protein
MKSLFDEYSETDDKEYLSAITNFKTALPLIDDFWNNYAPYADAKFCSQLRKQFLSRIWELWLGNIFLSEGFILKEKNDTTWPDFNLQKSNIKYYIEAICPDNASEESGNQILNLSPFVFQEIKSDLYELRIQNAIFEKYNTNHIKEIEKLRIPYLIAINGCKLPFSRFSFGDIPWIIKALYPIGSELAVLNETRDSFTTARQLKKYNKRKSGFELDKCIFSTNKYSLISAVIYTTSKINLGENEITKDVYIIKNPYARYKVEETFNMSEMIVEYNNDSFKYYIK